MRFISVSFTHFLVELDSLEETLALFDALRHQPQTGIEEVIPAARTLLVRFQPLHTSMSLLANALLRLPVTLVAHEQSPVMRIPVEYQGDDLAELAGVMGMTTQQVIQHHQEAVWKVAFTGFAPGFAYLSSPDWLWKIPRRRSPRTRIPPGALAVADVFSGIYPKASPGGWQLIGRTGLTMWDLDRPVPATLAPGDRVQFVEHKKDKIISLPVHKPTISPPVTGDTGLNILATGLQALWQDAGRTGYAAMGLSASGAMDRQALYRANRIVGNPREYGCLEITFGGLHIRAHQDMVMALTGAPCPLKLRTVDGEDFCLGNERPFNLAAGDELRLGSPARGVRSYLAVRNGFMVPPVLGSCSRDTLAQLGPLPLQAGDWVQISHHPGRSPVLIDQPPTEVLPAPGETITLDIILGPRTDWFTSESVARLTEQSWQVTTESNRVGLRLTGAEGLVRSQTTELPSEGTCSGAIQIPANGQPVLFLRDHPVTGGYPVIAVVADYHLDRAGQIPPGAFIRFVLIQPFIELSGEPACDH
ncbi:urea amidolyase family protein [Citrobacter sp. JGM124]|uniref:5-oxoprolinase subunit B/C family protein n=1 Tax=Citrobacter sp. JGM124 TaxID=2799789 RepID=UPI001BA9E620|nr:urea amidolyase family protein [Citrobacter sp. JGM124]MBS0848861.1 5-oxoprolinase/urea amidolyase family protein [Citrobacter sp. JGM124]